MQKAIFILAGLLLLGSLSVVKCYSYQEERDSDEFLSERRSEAATSNDWSQLYARLFESSDDAEAESEEETRQVASGDARCSGCKSDQLCYVPNKCSCPVGATTSPCQLQKAGMCTPAATKDSKPAVKLDFGSGSSQYSSATPASLGFSTKYKQVTSSAEKVSDGSFAIVNKVPHDFDSWYADLPKDHTSGDGNGYMMLVNAAYGAGVLFQITVKDLTVGLRYQLSAFFANINKKGTNIILPDILIDARTTDNVLIASTPTGKIPETEKLAWKQYGMSFVTPSSTIILTFTSNAGGGGGDDYVVDDVSLVACASIIDNAACGGK